MDFLVLILFHTEVEMRDGIIGKKGPSRFALLDFRCIILIAGQQYENRGIKNRNKSEHIKQMGSCDV